MNTKSKEFHKKIDTSPDNKYMEYHKIRDCFVFCSWRLRDRPLLHTGKLLVLFWSEHIFFFYLEDINYRCGSPFKYTEKVKIMNFRIYEF